MSQALVRIRQTARERKKERFTALFHHLSMAMLRTAFFALKRDAAPGIDGLTWRACEADLDRRIEDLHGRLHRGAYRALASRRRHIPKPDGRQRPLAIAALEDKIVQRAATVVLNAIYEEDFLGFSYGFRPQRSQHDALDALVVGLTRTKVNYILDADIRSFFDEVSQEWLIRFLEHRIGDKRIIRLIRKWLKAGVLAHSAITSPISGGAAFNVVASETGARGSGCEDLQTPGFRSRESFTPGRSSALPSSTRGGSRMREFRTYGSMRGALGNGRPYRDHFGFDWRRMGRRRAGRSPERAPRTARRR